MNRRSFLSTLFRATATVAFLGVARLSVADDGVCLTTIKPPQYSDGEIVTIRFESEWIVIDPHKRVNDPGLAHKLRPMT